MQLPRVSVVGVGARADDADRLKRCLKHGQALGGRPISTLAADLLTSIDPDTVAARARAEHNLPDDADPTDAQFDQAEQAAMAEALKPFHNPTLRDTILTVRSAEQVIDETTQDTLKSAGFDAAAKEKARSLLADFKKFIEDHKDEIEAIQILYSKPYRAGLRYRHVKELAKALQQPPLNLQQPEQRLWRLYEALEPDKVQATPGRGGKALVDLIALVRHAIEPSTPLVPVADVVEANYRAWLAEKQQAGTTFTPDQRKWLDAVKDHIANSLTIERDDLDQVPFAQMGGIGRAYQLFGDTLPTILNELNGRLAA